MKLKKGDRAPDFECKDIYDNKISLKDYGGKKLMLAFFRYAGCPFCALTFGQLVKNYDDFHKKGLHMITFFQSPVESVKQQYGSTAIPMPIVADPDKRIYDLYGVESSILKGAANLLKIPSYFDVTLNKHSHQGKIDGDIFLLPAEFLIEADQTIYKAHYGFSFDDSMSFIEIKNFVAFGV